MFEIFIGDDVEKFSKKLLSKKDKKRLKKYPNLAKNLGFLSSRSLLQKYKIKRNFSLSHKKNFSFIVKGKNVALDAEILQDRDFFRICEICFNETEKEILQNSSDKKMKFYEIWTLKEAVLKISKSNLTNIKFVGLKKIGDKFYLFDEKNKSYKFLSFVVNYKKIDFLISLVFN